MKSRKKPTMVAIHAPRVPKTSHSVGIGVRTGIGAVSDVFVLVVFEIVEVGSEMIGASSKATGLET